MAAVSSPGSARAQLPGAAVTGPVAGQPSFEHGNFSLEEQGYIEEEFLLAGAATSYKSEGELTNDGGWTVQARDTAPYATRLIVIRPSDPKRFNGTAVVEWLNVSAGQDVGVDWSYTHRELMRQGFAYVGVTAQRVGIDGNQNGPGPALKRANHSRYGQLQHPGDAYSFDIFSQAGLAVRGRHRVKPLGRLVARHVLATGNSQSATFLITYINAIAPIATVFDGYLVHCRGARGIALDAAALLPAGVGSNQAGTRIRTDLRFPVFTVVTETDVLSFVHARQPDSDRFRAWEIAGTSHGDSYLFNDDFSSAPNAIDVPSTPVAKLARAFTPGTFGGQLALPMNSAPQHHYVEQAAIDHLNRWVTTGSAPPTAPRIDMLTDAPPEMALDAHGNVRGGIRTPWVDVPLAKLSGRPQSPTGLAVLLGSTQIFDSTTLRELYGWKERLSREVH